LLPKAKREAIITLYDFCRRTDDIIDNDNSPEEKSIALCEWREQLVHSLNGKSKDPRFQEISSIAGRFNIPGALFMELIEGVKMDISKKRYETFDELYPYCYRVASTVGLMSIEIFGYQYPEAREYAINLGIALQLTNILRDLSIDFASGRVYLPQEDLRRCGYSERDIHSQSVNLSFRDLVQFECDRVRRYFKTARSFLRVDDLRSLYPAEAMARVYERLLGSIEKDPKQLYLREVRPSSFSRLGIALDTWMKYKLGLAYAD